MKKLRKLYFIGLFALLLAPFTVFAADGTRYLVKSNSQFWKKTFNARHDFKDGFTADLNDWQFRFGKILGVSIEPVGILQVLPEQEVKEVKAVKGMVKTRLLPSDQTPWGIESIYNDVNIAKTSGGDGVKVAIVDTGVTVGHPDLKARISKCKDFTNLRFPVVNGKCEDKNGHGTHVAGVILADGGADGLGIYGVAPAAVLYALKACSLNGTCYADDVAAAIKNAADDGANIINLSLGSDRPSVLIDEAVNYAVSKGVLVVAAAGNDGPYPESIDYPAAKSNVVAIGAFDSNFKIADWSSRGINSQTVPLVIEEKDMELAAPGVNIESTWNNGGYAVLSGTSMASPFVAGLVAKLWSDFSLEPDPAQAVREFLHKIVFDIDLPGEDNTSGFGFARVPLPIPQP
ncbi:MAG: sphaericase (sfericase) [Parcubacteria group bacterium Gr01-1014_44]|nr:MAG: sphaericase (sfericase) [Parcubacteria group bacterium Gr01-1014_44]